MGWLTFFRDIVGLHLQYDLWQRVGAYQDANAAGWWWPHREFVMVCDTPQTIHLETTGDGRRLHHDTAPAVQFRDGWALWFWHGLNVPSWVVEEPSPELIAAEPNAEVRRAAIESYGWDRWITHAGLTPVASAPDPGNAPHDLLLYDPPAGLYPPGVRLLLMTNGSVERDGTRRRYAETVPSEISDPVTAAAWRVGLRRDDYAALSRRT
jgi:hypothetical protein